MSDLLNQGGFSLPSGYSEIVEKFEAQENFEKTQNPNAKPVPEKNFTPFKHGRENYDNYLFRASSFGRLMGGLPKPLTDAQQKTYKDYHDRFTGLDNRPLTPKQEDTYRDLCIKKAGKIEGLSDGAKTYCQELVREDLYGRRRIIETKYMDKGIVAENASIKLYSEFIGKALEKNTERRKNEFFIGECDNCQGMIRDFKTAWDFHTFPIAATEIGNQTYEWQLQLYMDLWEMDEAELVYCLIDTPFRLVEDELRKMDWKYNLQTISGGYRDEHIPFVVERITNMIYTEKSLVEFCDRSSDVKLDWFDNFIEIPVEKRIKVFKTEANPKKMRQAKEMVAFARKYMNEINTKIA